MNNKRRHGEGHEQLEEIAIVWIKVLRQRQRHIEAWAVAWMVIASWGLCFAIWCVPPKSAPMEKDEGLRPLGESMCV